MVHCFYLLFVCLQVSIIQPGNFGAATNILCKKAPQDIWDEFDDARKLMFNQKYIEMACDYFHSVCASGFKDCTLVINAMLHALTAPKPQTRYLLVSWTDMLFFYICPILPTCITDSVFLMSSMYHKRKVMLYSKSEQESFLYMTQILIVAVRLMNSNMLQSFPGPLFTNNVLKQHLCSVLLSLFFV